MVGRRWRRSPSARGEQRSPPGARDAAPSRRIRPSRPSTSIIAASESWATSSSATSCSDSSSLMERSSSALASASSRTRAWAASLARRAACSVRSRRSRSASWWWRSVMSRAMITSGRRPRPAAAGRRPRSGRGCRPGARLGDEGVPRLDAEARVAQPRSDRPPVLGRDEGEDGIERVQLLRGAAREPLGGSVDVDDPLALRSANASPSSLWARTGPRRGRAGRAAPRGRHPRRHVRHRHADAQKLPVGEPHEADEVEAARCPTWRPPARSRTEPSATTSSATTPCGSPAGSCWASG